MSELVSVAGPARLFRSVAEQLRVLVVAGIPTGVIVVGVGSRLAMLALRLTSPDAVIGVQSDDDFTIGRFTLSGTYNLLFIGALVGVLGAAAYQWVAPWLIGPTWFRRFTVAASAGAVVGSLLIHADGIDFRLLQPTWFAIGLFILLPALFGAAIGASVDRVRRAASITTGGWRRWILPVALVAPFPPTALLLAVATPIYVVWLILCDLVGMRRLVTSRPERVVAQACWLAVAVLGLLALVGDIRALS